MLENAIKEGLLNQVHAIVEKNPSALQERFTSHSFTALHLAAVYAQHKVCRYLLEQGLCANATDGIGRSPLHVARNVAVVDALLFSPSSSRPPLICESTESFESNPAAVVKEGVAADVNLRSDTGLTPLHTAGTRHWKIAATLIAHGADVHALNRNRSSVAHYARDGQSIRLLHKHNGPIDVMDVFGFSPLHLSASKGRWSAVEAILSCGWEEKGVLRSNIHRGADGSLQRRPSLKRPQFSAHDVALEALRRNEVALLQLPYSDGTGSRTSLLEEIRALKLTLKVFDVWERVRSGVGVDRRIGTEALELTKEEHAKEFYKQCCWMGYEALSKQSPQNTFKSCLYQIPEDLVAKIVVEFVGPFGGHTGVKAGVEYGHDKARQDKARSCLTKHKTSQDTQLDNVSLSVCLFFCTFFCICFCVYFNLQMFNYS